MTKWFAIWLPDSLKSGHGYTRVSRISTDEICTIRAHPCPIERETKVRRAFTAYQSVSIRSIRVNPCTARSKVSGDQVRDKTSYVLTRGSRPEAVLIPYEDFLRFQHFQENRVLERFDRLLAKMAEVNAGWSEEEVARDLAEVKGNLDSRRH